MIAAHYLVLLGGLTSSVMASPAQHQNQPRILCDILCHNTVTKTLTVTDRPPASTTTLTDTVTDIVTDTVTDTVTSSVTDTVTPPPVTTTVTETVCPTSEPTTSTTPAPTCVPALGFNYTIYGNPFVREGGASAGADPYDNFDPSFIANASPVAGAFSYQGPPSFNLPASGAVQLYETETTLTQTIINGQAYVFSAVDQDVTISARTFDLAYVYTGGVARQGFNRDNWTSLSRGGSSSVVRNVDGVISVTGGTYTPLRFVIGISTLSVGNGAVFQFGLEGSLEDVGLFSVSCE